jgi:hypothetical protein
MNTPKLFMLMLGCTPKGRFTEQHDVFFGIANYLRDLIPAIKKSWPEAEGNIHIDAWREVSSLGNHSIQVVDKATVSSNINEQKLFFLNLGGYKPGEFDEFHYKMLTVAKNPAEAIKNAKQEAFYKHNGFKGAASHIDDKYGVDTDDLFQIEDILSPEVLKNYRIEIQEILQPADDIHLGYLPLWKIKN